MGTTGPRPRFSSLLGQANSGRLDAIGRSLSKSYSIHLASDSKRVLAGDPGAPVSVDRVPVDYTLKTKIRISSNSSLDWITSPDSTVISDAQKLFLSGHAPCRDYTNDTRSRSVAFHAALMSWAHPDSAPLTESQANIESIVDDRRSRWEAALHSLYFLFRNGNCSHFYFCDRRFTIMFASPCPGRSVAIVSQSTLELRGALAANGIEFTMPLGSPGDDADPSVLVDGSPESCIVISGRLPLHCLFNYLINRKYVGDVPKLLSLVPFKNASFQCLSPTFNQVTVSAKPKIGGRSQQLDESNVVEYSAQLLPMAVAVIIDVLRALASPFTMRLWTDGVSVPINHAGAYELAELASEMGFISVGDPSSNLWAHLSGTPTLGITKVSSDAPNADVVVEFGPAPRLPVFAASGVVRI